MEHRDVKDNARSIERSPSANLNPNQRKRIRTAVFKPAGFERSQHGTEPIFDLIQPMCCAIYNISALLFRYQRGGSVWMLPCYYISWNGCYCHIAVRQMGWKRVKYAHGRGLWIGQAKSDEFISVCEAWYLCYYDPGILMEILLVDDLVRLVLLTSSSSYRDINFMRGGFFEYFTIPGENGAVYRSFGFRAYRNLNFPVFELTFRSIADLCHKNHREKAKQDTRDGEGWRCIPIFLGVNGEMDKMQELELGLISPLLLPIRPIYYSGTRMIFERRVELSLSLSLSGNSRSPGEIYRGTWMFR